MRAPGRRAPAGKDRRMTSSTCPTCGRRLTKPRAKTPARAIGLPARFRNDPNWRPVPRWLPFGEHPADWAYPETGTREHTPSELRDLATITGRIAEHAGSVAIVDENTNTVTGWRPVEGEAA